MEVYLRFCPLYRISERAEVGQNDFPCVPAIAVTCPGCGRTGGGGPTLNRVGRIRAPRLSNSDRIATGDTSSGT
jgi:hypothetical protein